MLGIREANIVEHDRDDRTRIIEDTADATRRSACFGLFTQCAVEYDGRASSSLA